MAQKTTFTHVRSQLGTGLSIAEEGSGRWIICPRLYFAAKQKVVPVLRLPSALQSCSGDGVHDCDFAGIHGDSYEDSIFSFSGTP